MRYEKNFSSRKICEGPSGLHRKIFTKKNFGFQVNIVTEGGDVLRTRKIKSLSRKPIDQVTFRLENDGNITTANVYDYFSSRYGRLRFPFMPCINVRCKILLSLYNHFGNQGLKYLFKLKKIPNITLSKHAALLEASQSVGNWPIRKFRE